MNASRFAICIDAGDNFDLQNGRVYRVMDDDVGQLSGLIRVVDDSGEDYLYPADDFLEIAVPADGAAALTAALAS